MPEKGPKIEPEEEIKKQDVKLQNQEEVVLGTQKIENEPTEKSEFAPDEWMTANELADEINRNWHTVKKIAETFRENHPEWFKRFKKYLTKQHRLFEYYSPELIQTIKGQTQKIEKALGGWITRKNLADEINCHPHTVKRLAEAFRKEHPEWFEKRLTESNHVFEHYHPELAAEIRRKLKGSSNELRKKEFKPAPEGWVVITDLTERIGGTRESIKKIAEMFRNDHPEWFEDYLNKANVPGQHYSIEIIEPIKEKLSNVKNAPEGWATKNILAEKLGRNRKFINRLAESFRKEHPEWFEYYLTKKNIVYEHCSPELIEIITERSKKYETTPENWKTRGRLVKELGLYDEIIVKAAETFREDHPGWFKYYLIKKGRPHEHYSPELVEEIKKQLKDYKKELVNLIDQINSSETLQSKEFRSLVNLFGPGAATDILYKYHPEFRGLPVGYVRRIIADYLGNFLVERHGFSLDDLEQAGSLNESDVGLANSLFEIMKQDCLSFYQQNLLLGKGAVAQRIEQYKQKVGGQNSIVLNVIDRVNEYYEKFFDFKMPENMVDQIRTGREFPDFNQKINVQEIENKRRLLVADYMGLGKSASAIIAKEHLKCGTCVVVAPSNVIQTWTNYLKTENFVTDEEGNQKNKGGYFKIGQEPRVLVIDNPKDLEKLGGETYDYILISQEKLNNRYTKELTDLDYDMLIVDEVHKLKNLKEGIRSKNLVELAGRLEEDDKYLVMLSGTPIPNKIEDIAIELKLLYPEKFGDIDDKMLVQQIVQGDVLSLRELLLPRMQRKELGTSFEMPKLVEKIQEVTIEGKEKNVYELLFEEIDEVNASQKLQLLRQFLLNPEIVEPTPNFVGAKIEAADEYLQDQFTKKDKIVMFVNGYIEGVIRDEKSILNQFQLPPDVLVRVIEGNVSPADRTAIQRELREHKGKMLLVVSGQTADVGVDFSAGEAIYFYNEPWNKADKDQQTSRVYREGIKSDVEVTTSIARGTIEDGIHYYLDIKQRAIEKIILGIPPTELEKELLGKDEPVIEENLEVNPELARYYLSSVDRMLKIFSYVKEMGQKDFLKFLEVFGREYTDCYLDIGGRSYQGNNSRVSATLLDKMIAERNQDKNSIKILDIASGPEMLRLHSKEDIEKNIFSLDINRHHFEKSESGRATVGSFLKLPFANSSMEYVNLGFALDYTNFVPSQGKYERLEVLQEMHRVLKERGRAVITIVHNRDFKNEEGFKDIIASLGFRIVEKYTGRAKSGQQYRSLVVTLKKEKTEEKTIDEITEGLNKKQLAGLKFLENKKSKLRDSRHIIDRFKLNEEEYDIEFNAQDKRALEEQGKYIEKGRGLIKEYGGIKEIPADEIIANVFSRILVSKNYILFKKMIEASGAVIIREKK